MHDNDKIPPMFSLPLWPERASLAALKIAKLKRAIPFTNQHRCRASRGGGGKRQSASSERWLTRQRKDQYVKAAQKEGLPSRAIFKLEQIDQMIPSLSSNKGGAEREGIFHRNGQVVIDLGAYPGGWSVYVSQQIGSTGVAVAVDLLELDSVTKSALLHKYPARFIPIQGDFRTKKVKEDILRHLRPLVSDNDAAYGDEVPSRLSSSSASNTSTRWHVADVVLSDMAANFTGDQHTDALRTMSLCEDALMYAIGSSCFDPSATVPQQQQEERHWTETGVLKSGGTFLCKYFSCGKEHEKDLLEAARRQFVNVDIVKPPSSRRESAEKYLLARGFRGK